MSISRRNFLKTTAAAMATASIPLSTALVSSSPLIAEARQITSADYGIEKKTFLTCRMCAQNCPMVAYTRDGKLVRIEANPNTPYPSICARGKSAAGALYDPQRIKTPLLRVGNRGEGKFKSISWNEALDIITNKMNELRQNKEAHKLAYFPRFNSASLLDDALFSLYGTDNLFGYGDTCYGSVNHFGLGSVLGGKDKVEPRQGNSGVMGDYENSKLAVLIGRNPAGGLVAFPWGGMFGRGRKNGMKVVLIDPKKSLGVGETDMEWLPVKAGKDIGLLIGLAQVIFKNNYYDIDFLRKETNSDMLVDVTTLLPLKIENEFEKNSDYLVYDEFDNSVKMKSQAVKPALFGEYEYDGKKVRTSLEMIRKSAYEMSLEEASKISGIPVAQIEKLGKDLNDTKPACFLERGYRTARYYNSLQEKYLISSINALLGVYGKKGGLIYGRNVKMKSPLKKAKDNEISINKWFKKNLKEFELSDPKNLRRTFAKACIDGMPYTPKMVFLNGQNPIGGSSGGNDIAEAFKKMELVAAVSPFWNESLLYADVILPDTTFLERSEPLYSSYKATFPVISTHNQVVEPMFETRNGYWIMLAIAKRVFTPEEYEKNFKDFENGGIDYIVEYQLNSLSLNEEDSKLFSRRVLIENGVWCGTPSKVKPQHKLTRSNKIEVYSTFLATVHNKLVTEHRMEESEYYTPLYSYVRPYFEKLKPALDNDEFIPITGFHPLSSFTGAQTRNNVLLKNIGTGLRYSTVFINASKGKSLGLKTGDIVEIFNIEKPDLKEIAEITLTEGLEQDSLFAFYGVGNGLYKNLSDKLNVASKIGFNPNHIGNLTFTPLDATAPQQDFIVKIRKVANHE